MDHPCQIKRLLGVVRFGQLEHQQLLLAVKDPVLEKAPQGRRFVLGDQAAGNPCGPVKGEVSGYPKK